MRIVVFIFIACALPLIQNCARQNGESPVDAYQAVNQPLDESPIFAFKKLLWIGAHPDDEIPSASLLKDFCGRPGNSCTLLSFTEGEAGQCKLSGGCVPDVSSVRAVEFA